MTLLIDADVLLYKACLKSEEAIDWGDDLWTLHSDMKTARQFFDIDVQELMTALNDRSVVCAFSSRRTFRYDLLDSYKWNRKGRRKPLSYPVLRQHVLDAYKCVVMPKLEGDDVLGILATNREYDDPIIVTIDKDLKGIPGKHYNPDKPEVGVLTRTKEDADNWHLIQTIAGDPTDGYSGIPGIGVKRATARLEKFGYTWGSVVQLYEEHDLTHDDTLLMARMAKILDWSCWDPIQEEVLLWKPYGERQALSVYQEDMAYD